MRALAALLVLGLSAPAAQAGLSRADLGVVAAAPPAEARLDLRLTAPDIEGATRTIGGILAGRPAFLVFVDYTCNTLCGTDLELLAAAIGRSRLDPSRFRIVVLGIDSKDPPQTAAAMEEREIPAELRPAAAFLLPDAATVTAAAHALGFRYVYDSEHDQFAHPAAVYVVAPDGSVRTMLSPFDLTGIDLTKALDPPAASGTGLYDRVRLLCYGYDPATGRYTLQVTLLLRIAGGLAVVLLAGSIVLLARIGKQTR